MRADLAGLWLVSPERRLDPISGHPASFCFSCHPFVLSALLGPRGPLSYESYPVPSSDHLPFSPQARIPVSLSRNPPWKTGQRTHQCYRTYGNLCAPSWPPESFRHRVAVATVLTLKVQCWVPARAYTIRQWLYSMMLALVRVYPLFLTFFSGLPGILLAF